VNTFFFGKLNMGHRSSKPIVKPATVNQKLSAQEVKELNVSFQLLAKSHDFQNGKIPKDDFIRVYLKKRLPKLSQPILERLFVVLSYRGKDDLNYEEFRHGVYLLDHIPSEPTQGNKDILDMMDEVREDRIRLIFNLMDLDFNGKISLKELRSVLPNLIQDATIKEWNMEESVPERDYWYEQIARFAMITFDRSRRQELSEKDFKRLAAKDQTIKDFLSMLTPKSPEFPMFPLVQQLIRNYTEQQEKRKRPELEKLPDNALPANSQPAAIATVTQDPTGRKRVNTEGLEARNP